MSYQQRAATVVAMAAVTGAEAAAMAATVPLHPVQSVALQRSPMVEHHCVVVSPCATEWALQVTAAAAAAARVAAAGMAAAAVATEATGSDPPAAAAWTAADVAGNMTPVAAAV